MASGGKSSSGSSPTSGSKYDSEQDSSSSFDFPIAEGRGFRRRGDKSTIYEPYRDIMTCEFVPDERLYKQLMEETDIQTLKKWIMKEYAKICGYDYFKELLVEFLNRNDSSVRISVSHNPAVIVTAIKRYFDEVEKKFKAYNLSFSKINILEGSELGKRAEYYAGKMYDEMDRNRILVDILAEDAHLAGIRILNLEEEKKALEEKLAILTGENLRDVAVPEDFVSEMQVHLMKKENLQSSLLEEAEREKITINNMYENVFRLQEEVIALNKEKLDEIAQCAKDLELERGIRKAILKKLQKLEADPKICEKAVNDWMIAIHATVGEKQEDIENLKRYQASLDDDVAEKAVLLQKLEMENEELDAKLLTNRELLEIKNEDNERFIMEYEDLISTVEGIQDEIEQLREQLAELDQEYIALSKELDTKKYEVNVQQALESSGRSSRTSGSPRSAGSPGYMDRSSLRSPKGSVQSPEIHRDDSPDRFRNTPTSRPSDRSSPTSLASSRSPDSPCIPLISVRPPSPDYVRTHESISPQNLSEQTATVVPGTQTISRPQSTRNPSTQTISGVRNRFDIGQGINMQTVTTGSPPKPYHQATRVDSKLPVTGTSRMADSSFSLTHTAELTPTQFVTPFISTTRFGYTDPTAKVLNLPPGDDLDIGTSLRKTLLLTSPKREQPLLVNIDVDPKPLTQSSSGEHFICDISLDLKQPHEQQSVFPYGIPPAATHTAARRHGLDTPKGISKKKDFKIRKLLGPDYESPEMPSHYLPYDSRSPITGFPPSPCYEDKSISWEKSSDFDVPIMDRTFDAPSPSSMSRKFDAPGPSAMNRTFDAPGPSAMNRTFDAPGPSAMNRTFNRSPSPVPGRSRSPSPAFDRTCDTSPSPAIDRTYDSSSSPVIKGSLHAGLSPYRSSGMSESPVIKRPFYGSRSPDSSSGMSSSPVIKKKFETSSPLDRTSERSPSPLIKGKVYTYNVPPAATATTSRRHGPFTPRGIFKKQHFNVRRLYDSNYLSPEMPSHYLPFDSRSPITGFPPSPPSYEDKSISWERSSDRDTLDENLMNLTSDKSPSPSYGRRPPAQSRESPSPLIKGPYFGYQSPSSGSSSGRSASPMTNRTSDSSPGYDSSLDRSASPRYNNSPQMNVTFETSPPNPMNRTSESSPGYDSSLDRSASPRYDNSPQMNVAFDSSPPNPMNRTFDSTASSQGTSPQAQQNRTLDDASSERSEELDKFHLTF